MKQSRIKTEKRDRRHRRIRAKISGAPDMPRLSVYKSNRAIYGQLIDDTKGTTLVSITTVSMKGKGMIEKAKMAGQEIAKKASEKKVKKVVFDRGGFIYTGQIQAFAEGAREGGLVF